MLSAAPTSQSAIAIAGVNVVPDIAAAAFPMFGDGMAQVKLTDNDVILEK